MNLNTKDKVKVRDYIEAELGKIPEGTRISLDKDLLESLIFETIFSKNEGIKIKFPVWTGEFLRKIDLSEISFENCVTSNTKDSIKSILIYELKIPEEKAKKRANEIYKGTIDFSYTNININFDKIYTTAINFWDFEGVDLSNSNIDSLNKSSYCNFTSTNIKITDLIQAENCIFDNCDFSELSILIPNRTKSIKEDLLIKLLLHNSFKNTGLKINCDDFTTLNQYKKDKFKVNYRLGYYDNCYINNHLVRSREKIKENKQNIKEEYTRFKENIYNSINKEITKVKKKDNDN